MTKWVMTLDNDFLNLNRAKGIRLSPNGYAFSVLIDIENETYIWEVFKTMTETLEFIKKHLGNDLIIEE